MRREGGYFQTRRGPKFWRVGPPTDDEIQALVMTLAQRVIRLLKKKGYFQDDVDWAVPEKETLPEALWPELQAASVQSRIALGERKGGYVRRLGALDFTELRPERKGPLCAQVAGFSLHAAVYCKPWQRNKLEMLCRYITRPAVAEERRELQASGDIILRLKTPYGDGTTHLLFSGLEFVEKLAALNILSRVTGGSPSNIFGTIQTTIPEPVLLRPDDRKNYGENRLITTGVMNDIVVILTFTLREERIRIISVRKANKHERKIYHDQIASQQN